MISFRNAQHAVASFFKKAYTDIKSIPAHLPGVEAAIEKVEDKKEVIEAVSAVAAGAVGSAAGVPAPLAVKVTLTVEDALFAVLAGVDVALKAGGAAAEQKLLDAGLDQAAIDAAKAVGSQSKAVYTLVAGK